LFSIFSILSLSFLISPELFKVAFFDDFFNLLAEDCDPCLVDRRTSCELEGYLAKSGVAEELL